MIKIKRKQVILFLLLVTSLVVLSSCAKPECKDNPDCASRTCYIPKCEDKKCSYNMQRNCCGNRINESIENGMPGGKCTCPQDYGKCEGKGKVKRGSREEDAAYVRYFCNENSQCVFGIDGKDATRQNLLDTTNTGFFKVSSIVSYNKPFEVAVGTFDFTITLDDAGKDLIFPVVLTKIKILYSGENARVEQLVAENEINAFFNGIGEKAAINTPLTFNYKPQELEEQGSFRYSVDYTYKKRVPSGKAPDGTTLYSEETVRSTFNTPSKPVFLVRSG